MLTSVVFNVSSNSYNVEYTLSRAQPDQLFIDQLRKIVTIGEVLIGGLCIILLLRKETRSKAILLGGWFASCFLFPLVAQGAVFGRFLVFAVFPCALLVTAMMSRASKYRLNRVVFVATLILLIASALIIPLINYGGDYYEFLPQSRISLQQYIDSKNVPSIRISDFAGDGFLTLAAEEPHNVYLMKGRQWYNFFQVKYSRGDEYTGMFDRAGQNSIYTNGDYSLHGYSIDNPS
jgi:hypothetical protein